MKITDRASRSTALTAFSRRLAAAGLLGLALAGAAHAFELRVEVLNVKAGQGQVNGGLYADPTQWMKAPLQGVRQPAAVAGASTVLVYRDLPAGSYALSLFQDLNDNGRLDRNPIGMPTEPYGFSRDAMGTMGPPSFADAALDLKADTTITITLR